MSEPAAPRSPGSMSFLHGAIRFALELVIWGAFGLWGWTIGDGGALGIVLGALFITVTMALWGVFGTPGDGSRGAPVISTPGPLRLLLEIGLFAGASYALWICWNRAASETFMTVAAIHYAITWERSRWLLTGRS